MTDSKNDISIYSSSSNKHTLIAIILSKDYYEENKIIKEFHRNNNNGRNNKKFQKIKIISWCLSIQTFEAPIIWKSGEIKLVSELVRLCASSSTFFKSTTDIHSFIHRCHKFDKVHNHPPLYRVLHIHTHIHTLITITHLNPWQYHTYIHTFKHVEINRSATEILWLC